MIIVKLMGGLGNQMFQYAFGKYLSEKHSTDLKLDTSFLLDRNVKIKNHVYRNYDLDIFKLKAEFASQQEIKSVANHFNNVYLNAITRKLIGKKKAHVIETDMSFMNTAFNSSDNVYLEGYWQSEKYFKQIAATIKSEFTLKGTIPEKVEELAQEILQSNSVCINIRRGDFLVSSTHGVCSPGYYYKAEKDILKSNPDAFFYVFSDDIEWCIQNLKFSAPTYFVKHEYAGNKFEWYLYLMMQCKHFIIANSSFAWWAAYLAKNTDKIVIAPSKWVMDASLYNGDIYPNGWLKI